MTEDQLKEYCEYLNDNGIKSKTFEEGIIVDAHINDKNIVLKCIIDDVFPYRIPQLLIDRDESDEVPSMPHISENGTICTFNDNTIPNINNSKRLLIDTINKGIDIIDDGLNCDGLHDYLDELNVYWNCGSMCQAEMFVENTSEAKKFYWCNINKRIIIADNALQLKSIIFSLEEIDIDNERIKEGLLIRIRSDSIKGIPQNDIELFRLIKSGSPDYKEYCSFLRKNIKKPKLLVLSVMGLENQILLGYLHAANDTPNGFRKGHENLEMIFNTKHNEGERIKINNCHQKRLFQRGGDGKTCLWGKVALIGCGSVGSMCADALKYSGTKEFLLVDNDLLEYENIARHICGYSDVGKKKTEAISKKMRLDNPNIVCSSFHTDAMTFVDKHNGLINKYDVVIVAVGSLPVELFINNAIDSRKIIKPVIIMWAEPFMMGGHAILIKQEQDLFEELFDKSKLEFRHHIVNNPSQYLKREAGCNSSFMPYSGFELQSFVNRIIGYILNDCWDKKGNFLITWCGRLSDAEENGIEISKEYKDKEDYSIIIKRID